MINNLQFNQAYPYLSACFAQSDPNSPTYTRKTKTGKIVTVRKGKRKSGIDPVSSGLGGLAALNAIAALGTAGTAKLMDYIPEAQHKKVLIGGFAGSTALGVLGGLKVYKKLRGDKYGTNEP